MRKLLIILALLIALAVLLLAPSYLRYRRTRGAVPPGVRLAGQAFGSADAATVKETMDRLFSEPVAVYHADQRIFLRPQMVKFQVEASAMLAESRTYDRLDHLVRVWVGEALERPLTPIEVPLRYSLDHDALDNWLADIAARYDRQPAPPRASTSSLSILPGQAGLRMDQPASRARVIAALANPQIRSANLVLRETAPASAGIQLLAELLARRLDEFPGVAGLFLHHVPTGDEVAINADVAYSAMSTMKIAILEEVFRKLSGPPDAQTTGLMTETASLAGNQAANELLALVGDGDAKEGVTTLNQALRTMGLKDSFMAAPYDETGPRVVTVANRRTDLNTHPDPYVQTTPRDMGLMLAMIVACQDGGGTLLAAFPGQLTPAECRQITELIKLNDVTDLIVSGLPQGAVAVHKHGYVAEAHGDVAAVWGPAGPYVLSIYLFRSGWLEWDFSSATMGELSKAAWDYFALVSQQ